MSKLKVYRYGYKNGESMKSTHPGIERWDDLIVLARPCENKPRTLIGCVIGSGKNREKYPIGEFSDNWDDHMDEISDSIILKSKERLYTDGNFILLKTKGGTLSNYKEGYTLISEDDVIDMSSDVRQSVHRDTATDDVLWVSLKFGNRRLSKFERIEQVKFN